MQRNDTSFASNKFYEISLGYALKMKHVRKYAVVPIRSITFRSVSNSLWLFQPVMIYRCLEDAFDYVWISFYFIYCFTFKSIILFGANGNINRSLFEIYRPTCEELPLNDFPFCLVRCKRQKNANHSQIEASILFHRWGIPWIKHYLSENAQFYGIASTSLNI